MHFSAALLAGGRSSRMGRDKAFIEIDGVPLWQRQLRTLQMLAPSEIFISGPARPEWIDAGLEVISDAKSDAGPLAALVAALRRCTTPRLLVLAVDLPNMTSDFLARLLSSCPTDKGVIPRSNERFEPLVAVYPVTCSSLAESLLEAGCITGGTALSLHELAARAVKEELMIEKQISGGDQALFFNLNTPEDLAFQRDISLARENA
jgi:molybdopterin-guanine dinucleotide biosynthesis protein A